MIVAVHDRTLAARWLGLTEKRAVPCAGTFVVGTVAEASIALDTLTHATRNFTMTGDAALLVIWPPALRGLQLEARALTD